MIPSYPMYSAGQIAAATFLGSPIAGGWLLALNYKRLGESRSARAAIGLSVLAMAALIASALVVLDRAMSPLGIIPVVVMYVVYMVMMYWIAKSLQDAGYQRHLARLGRTASNWRVLGIALASLAICGGTIVGAVIGYDTWNAPGEITVGSSNVLYTGGATRAEAQAVGDALVGFPYFRSGAAWTVEVARDHGRHVVAFVVQDFVFGDDQAQQAFYELADELSRRAFAGEPLDVWLADDGLDPRVKLAWEARPRKLELGDDHVVAFRQGGLEAEARGVAKILEQGAFFVAGTPATVVVRRQGPRHVVAFFFADGFHDASLAAECRKYAGAFSSEVFGGQPIDIWINDRDGVTQAKLDWETRPR